MGLCSSKSAHLSPEEREREKAAKKRDRELDKAILKDEKVDAAISKLLLLGAGESGKSTLFKQMRDIYGKGFDEEYRRGYESIVYNNVVIAMRNLINAVAEHGAPVAEEVLDSLKYVQHIPDHMSATIDSQNVMHFKALWKDSGIQTCYTNRSKFQLSDSVKYFFDKIDAIAAAEYVPTTNDVLRARVKTSGIIEYEFEVDTNSYKMFDVGGQRNERKKWIHCFENVKAVLFFGVLSEYDLVLHEDETMNRMQETLTLFNDICVSPFFERTSIILFLNKRDLFEEKIPTVSLQVCPIFEHYAEVYEEDNGTPLEEGWDTDYERGKEAIEFMFMEQNTSEPKKQIYVHVTCATDRNNVKVVFEDVKDIIIQNCLKNAGLVG